jgi:hypothetical protein
MSRLLRAALFGLGCVIGAPVLLLAGLIVTEGLWHLRHHRYESPPWGFWHEMVRGRAWFASSNETADRMIFLQLTELTFAGENALRWQWREETPRYSELTLTWFEDEPTPLGGSVRLRLASMRFENEQTNGLLTQEALALWLANHDRHVATNAAVAAAIGDIFGIFHAAARGTLSAPRHHGYEIKSTGSQLAGRYQHFRTGIGLSTPGWLWVLAWPFVCVVGIRKWLAKNPAPSPSVASVN